MPCAAWCHAEPERWWGPGALISGQCVCCLRAPQSLDRVTLLLVGLVGLGAVLALMLAEERLDALVAWLQQHYAALMEELLQVRGRKGGRASAALRGAGDVPQRAKAQQPLTEELLQMSWRGCEGGGR